MGIAGEETMQASKGTAAQPLASLMRVCLAWGVHLLTASGAAAGVMAVVETAHHRWIAAFAWMIVAIVVDSVDGSLARLCDVKRVLPRFDGALLDNIVDYFTYVVVPAFFLYESGLMPPRWGLAGAIAMTLVSAYQFCQADAKTEDCFFRGFPSYWNVVVFYLFMMPMGEWINLIVIGLLAVAVFVPVKYLYPSRTVQLRPLTLTLTSLWGVLLLLVLLRYPEAHAVPLYASLLYVAYYAAVSLYLTISGAGVVH